jgi:hypothetical protein
MIQYLWSKLDNHTDKLSIIEKLPINYSLYSSQVHGGSHGGELMHIWGHDPNERCEENASMCRLSYLLSTMMKLDTFITVGQYDQQFLRYTKPIMEFASDWGVSAAARRACPFGKHV